MAGGDRVGVGGLGDGVGGGGEAVFLLPKLDGECPDYGGRATSRGGARVDGGVGEV